MVGITDLKTAFESEGYKLDLSELSSYTANIIQELPMMLILSKYLSRNGFKPVLEMKKGSDKFDLVVDDTTIEAKFYYDCDMVLRLGSELSRWVNIKQIKQHIHMGRRTWRIDSGYTWTIAVPIVKDILYKKPDIFILIVLSRDLSRVVDKSQVNWTDAQDKYNNKLRYNYNDSRFKREVTRFLKMIKPKRKFKKQYFTTSANRDFPSTYHIWLLEFN